MKNPNGYGCIKKLSGTRRRPFAFVVSDHGKQRVVAYFATQVEALAYQVDYNAVHGKDRLSKITFAELYLRWLPKHIEYFHVSQSTINGYKCAYRHCTSLYDMPVTDIRYKDLQGVIDNMHGLSYSSKKKVRNLISLMFAYARKMEYTSRDFTGLIRIRRSKTEAGIRIIPIHHCIWPFIEKRLASPGAYLLTIDGKPCDYSRFRRLFARVMKSIHGEKYKPHDTRHTCATLLDDADVNENSRKMILGHARPGVTDGVYTHKSLCQLRKAIERL